MDAMFLEPLEGVPMVDHRTPTGARGCHCDLSYFFALDSEGRTAWPFRVFRNAHGQSKPERWRFGHWVHSPELDRILAGKDDLWIAASADDVESWIERQSRFWPVLPHPTRHTAHRR